MNHRNRALLDLAHRVHRCTNCARHVEHGCEPAHANWSEYGKGGAIKAHDCHHAALCHDCHAWLDQGRGIDPSGCYDGVAPDKKAMWVRAAASTLLIYWLNDWLKVR